MKITQDKELFMPIHIKLESEEECLAIVRAIESYRLNAIGSEFKANNMKKLDPLHAFLANS